MKIIRMFSPKPVRGPRDQRLPGQKLGIVIGKPRVK